MHTFKKGDKVKIINSSAKGFFVEGTAEVVRRIRDSEEYYEVRFVGRRDTLERFVDPQAQADADDFVKQLNAPRRAARG